MKKIDKTNRKILKILQENSKITNLDLSKNIKLSPAPTLERVKKLETKQVIVGYHAEIDPEKLGLNICTYVLIQVNSQAKEAWNKFITKVKRMENIVQCEAVTGDYDAMLKIYSRNMEEYENLVIHEISAMPEVSRTSTMFVLSKIKEDSVLPFDYDLDGKN